MTHYGTDAETVNKSYTYDAIGRITQSTIGTDTTGYTYDKADNHKTQTANGTNFSRRASIVDKLMPL